MSWTFTNEDGSRIESIDEDRKVYTYDTEGALVDERDFTADENATLDAILANRQREDDRRQTLAQARNAIQANNQFLNLNAPTQAQALQQIKALTRQMNGLARILAYELDYIDND